MKEESIFRKEWEFNHNLSQPFGDWQLSYPSQSEIEILTKLCEILKEFIRPIFIKISVLVGPNRKEAKIRNGFYYNNPNAFSITEIESLYKQSLDQVQAFEHEKFTRFYLSWQAFISYYNNNKLISEWYPSSDNLLNQLKQYPNIVSFDGLIDSTILDDFMAISTYTDIWIPENRNDKVALINGQQLRNMLMTIEKITGGKIEQWSENKWLENPPGRNGFIERYGFIHPDELPSNYGKK
jgi:hypothetical protein